MAIFPISTLRQLWPSFHAGERLINGSDLNNLANLIFGTATGITALAGGGAPGAPQLSAAINEVSVCATNADSVVLSQAIPGVTIKVINNGAASLRVFPMQLNPVTNAADSIVAAGAVVTGASADQATTKIAEYTCYKQGIWKQNLSG